MVSASASRPYQRHHRQRRRPAPDGQGVTCDSVGLCLTASLPQDGPSEIQEGSSRNEDEKVSHVTAFLFLLLFLIPIFRVIIIIIIIIISIIIIMLRLMPFLLVWIS